MKKTSLSQTAAGLALLIASLALVCFPKEISLAVSQGLQTCTTLLLPNLFAFFVVSSMVVKLGLSGKLEQLFQPLMRPLFRLPGSCSCALMLGLLGGYPTGARIAVSLYQEGRCSRMQIQRLLTFCNNCGPAFLFGAVGSGIFGHVKYGLCLTCVHIGAAVLTGVILNRRAPDTAVSPMNASSGRPTSLSAAFVDSVTDSMHALLNLFAFVLCFSAITQLVILSRLPELLGTRFLPFLSPENSPYFLLGLLEMTLGVTHLSAGGIQECLILTSALLGWGGLSVHCQVLSLLRDTDLSPTLYFMGKALHAFLSAFLMAALFHPEVLGLMVGGGLVLIPCTAPKKSSGKSAKGIV